MRRTGASRQDATREGAPDRPRLTTHEIRHPVGVSEAAPAIRLVDVRELGRLWRVRRSDFVLAIVTFDIHQTAEQNFHLTVAEAVRAQTAQAGGPGTGLPTAGD